MKALLRTAAVLSFGSFLAGGLVLVRMAWLSSTYRDAAPLGVVGLFFIGTAFFVGPLLLVAAERFAPKDSTMTKPDGTAAYAKEAAGHSAKINWRSVLGILGAVVVGLICLGLARRLLGLILNSVEN
jgi:hypothetical protein